MTIPKLLALAPSLAALTCAVPWPTRAASTDGVVTLEFTTTEAPGKYSPKHVLAVWVADARTNLLQTLEVRGGKRQKYLPTWLAARGENTTVDGVTGATLGQHQAHRVTWNCRDHKGALMPDGSYLLFVELTSKNGAGPVAVFPFAKGPQTQSLRYPKQTACGEASLAFKPTVP